MLGKVVCLVAVLIIAAHAAETYADAAETAAADVGPAMVSLAETGSSVLRRRLDEFALDAVDFHDDEDALHSYEEEVAESKHARRDRRRRRRERRAKRIEEQMLADEAEMDKEEHARHEAKKFRKNKKAAKQAALKARQAAHRAQQAAKGATFQARDNVQLHTNETDVQRDARKRLEKNRKLTKKDKKLFKKILKLEKKVKRHNAIAKDLEAKARLEHATKHGARESDKWARRDRSTAYAVNAGVSKVTQYQGQIETEDLHSDRRFWDAYYGRKHKESKDVKNDPKHQSLDRMVKNLQQKKEVPVKKVDRSIELYKAAHVASFADAYGMGEVKKLDSNLKEDGDKYIQFFQELN